MSSLRQKPESPRTMIFTAGQAVRICLRVPLYFLPAAEGGNVIGLAQACAQNMLTAEDVKRQIGGVPIQDDLLRSLLL